MALIVYGDCWRQTEPGGMEREALAEFFAPAARYAAQLEAMPRRVAYFFIDPFFDSFRAANQFYGEVLRVDILRRLSSFHSGMAPVQAVAEAGELIDAGLFDAVFVFGCEPLLTELKRRGRDAFQAGMSTLYGAPLPVCYNELARHLAAAQGISAEAFAALADALFSNYEQSYDKIGAAGPRRPRGDFLTASDAGLFRLTDCANPNIDFCGGILLCNEATAEALDVAPAERAAVCGAACRVMAGDLGFLPALAAFPHLRAAIKAAEQAAGISIPDLFNAGRLALEAYTCYPPIPLALLLSAGLIDSLAQAPAFLARHPITVTGGMNLARAPWNNPALYGLIALRRHLLAGEAEFGLVHGNGGIGEFQGVALLRGPRR